MRIRREQSAGIKQSTKQLFQFDRKDKKLQVLNNSNHYEIVKVEVFIQLNILICILFFSSQMESRHAHLPINSR